MSGCLQFDREGPWPAHSSFLMLGAVGFTWLSAAPPFAWGYQVLRVHSSSVVRGLIGFIMQLFLRLRARTAYCAVSFTARYTFNNIYALRGLDRHLLERPPGSAIFDSSGSSAAFLKITVYSPENDSQPLASAFQLEFKSSLWHPRIKMCGLCWGLSLLETFLYGSKKRAAYLNACTPS